MSTPSALVEHFYNRLGLPVQTRLGARIYKKQLLENAELTATDRKWVNEDIDTLEWRYTLKPATLAIPRYDDAEREYIEIALLHITLKSPAHSKRLGEVIQRAIPYPLVLVFEHDGGLAINLADKRISRGDSSKLTVEQFFDTGWLVPDNLGQIEQDFLADFTASHCSHQHLYAFYQDLIRRVVALESARHTGQYQPSASIATDQQRQTYLQTLRELQQRLVSLNAALKTETQFNRKLEFNLQIKQLKQQMQQLTGQLSG
jgi:hypothetical protein